MNGLPVNTDPVMEIVLVRSVLSVALTFAAGRARAIAPLYGSPTNWPLLGMRGAIGASAMTVFYESILRLPLADAVSCGGVGRVGGRVGGRRRG